MPLDDELIAALDRVIAAHGYQNRSEVVRDLSRAGIAQLYQPSNTPQFAVAALVYVYEHRERKLAKRLTRSSHEHHDLSVATINVHLDHDSCMEVAVLKGAMRGVHHFARHVVSEHGVRHGQLVTVPVEFDNQKHART